MGFRINKNIFIDNIPESMKIIDRFAFFKCASLTSVIIPGNVTEIGEYAFYAFSSLMSIIIPYGVISIANHCAWRQQNLIMSVQRSVIYQNSRPDCMTAVLIQFNDLFTFVIGGYQLTQRRADRMFLPRYLHFRK